MREFLKAGWASWSSWFQTAVVIVAILLAVLLMKDVRRAVSSFLIQTEAEVEASNGTFAPVDYCRTQNRLVCVWERAPQSVKDFRRKSFDGGQVCEKR